MTSMSYDFVGLFQRCEIFSEKGINLTSDLNSPKFDLLVPKRYLKCFRLQVQ